MVAASGDPKRRSRHAATEADAMQFWKAADARFLELLARQSAITPTRCLTPDGPVDYVPRHARPRSRLPHRPEPLLAAARIADAADTWRLRWPRSRLTFLRRDRVMRDVSVDVPTGLYRPHRPLRLQQVHLSAHDRRVEDIGSGIPISIGDGSSWSPNTYDIVVFQTTRSIMSVAENMGFSLRLCTQAEIARKR
jgi:hypothetical protein